MIHKLIKGLSILMLLAFTSLLVVKMKPIFLNAPNQQNIAYNDVSGITVLQQKIPYTLNFEQQCYLIHLLNKLNEEDFTSIVQEDKEDTLIIHRFDKPDLILSLNDNNFGKMNLCLNNF